MVSIIGPSGTGKSTLLRFLNLLETSTAGEIIVDGEVSTGIEEFGRRQLLSRRQINNLQLVFEELCVQTLLRRAGEALPLRFSAFGSELDGTCEAAIF